MVAPFNIPAITDTKLFSNEKNAASAKNDCNKKINCVKLGFIFLLVFILVTFLMVLFLFSFDSTPWYKTATLYQVDIGTFQDSDGDGIGDLKGLNLKTVYLGRQNIKALMLSSLYESENDGVVDHKDVCYTCGTMDDFRELVKQLKKRGIRLIIDFNPNHTSNKHPWFQDSIKGVKSYDDYYIWSDSSLGDEKRPPNNWLNVNGESAWTWNDERKQFYLSTFGKHLPDLNLRNPLVRNELKDIITFWMEEGVDGFRVIAASHLVENAYLFDEPVLMSNKAEKLKYENVHHIFTTDQYENLDLLAEWKQIINSFNTDGILIAEVSGSPHRNKMYYGNETFPLASLVYNTDFTRIWGNVTGTELRRLFASISDVPSYGWPAMMIGSKSVPRLESRVGDLIDGIHMAVMIAKGTPITYAGDEFGVSSFPSEDNVQISIESESHLNVYSSAISARSDFVFTHGVQQYPIVTDKVFSLMRCYEARGYFSVINLSDDPITLDFTGTSSRLPPEATLLLQSRNFVNSSLSNKEQQNVLLNNVNLGPKHGAFFSFGPSVNVHFKKNRRKM